MNQLALNGVRLITFDVTGTLLKFRKPPVQVYLDFAAKSHLNLDEDTVKKNFKKQWKIMNDVEPHFGKCWRTWWTKFVVNTLKDSNPDRSVSETAYTTIALQLIEHFNTEECWDVKEGARDLLEVFAEWRKKHTAERSGFRELLYEKPWNYQKHPVIGVVSNFDPRLHNILKLMNLRNPFDFCLTSFDVQCSKPSPQIFLYAMDAWRTHHGDTATDIRLTPDETLHIGNSFINDYIGATCAGWNAALVLSPEEEEQEIPKDVSPWMSSGDRRRPVIFKDLFELKSYFETNLEEMCYT